MRQLKRTVKIGNITIGGTNPIAVQTMLNVPVKDIAGNVEQAKRVAKAGCQIVRVTVRPELLFRAFRAFRPYCRGLGGDSPPSRRRHCLSSYYFDSVKSASITSSSAFLPPAAPAPGWAPAVASAPGCWP